MTNMVDMIEMAKQNIVELEEMAKKNAKALAALLQEKDNIDRDLSVNRKIVEDLSTIRENEIQVVMAEKPKTMDVAVVTKPKKRKYTRKKSAASGIKGLKVPVNAIDEKDTVIAMYKSYSEAAKDLGISQCTVKWRIDNISRERQLEKNGYALVLR